MRRRALTLLPAVLLPLTLGLAACGGSDSDSTAGADNAFNPPSSSASADPAIDAPSDAATQEPSDEPSTAESVTPPSTDPSAADTAPATGSGDYTPAGTQLKIGESAKISYSPVKKVKSDLTLTLDSIDRGNPADLKALKLGDQAAGQVPYYLRFTVTGGAGSQDLKFYTLNGSAFDGLLPDGSQASPLFVIGDWKPCNGPDFPSGYGPGQKLKVCFPVLAGQSTKVVGVQYAESDTPYDQFKGKPIVWK